MGSKNSGYQALDASLQDLQKALDEHCNLVRYFLQGQVPENASRCTRSGSDRELELEQAIHEAIEVLEDTRKSFKSKQLGALRKKLIRVLTDASVPE